MQASILSGAMTDFLTTSDIARMYGLADSTIRHYRASGRLVPTQRTPGGHARYAIDDVIKALGSPSEGGSGADRELRITGLTGETFAPPGQHDIRSSGRRLGVLPPEMVALGVREAPEPPPSAREPARWGGRLVKPRRRVAA